MQNSTYFSADQLLQGGLTAELLHALKTRLNGVIGQITEMRQLSAYQGEVLRSLGDEVVRDADAAGLADRPERAHALEDLQRIIRLTGLQSVSIDNLAKLAELISDRLQAPLRQLRFGGASIAAEAQPAGVIKAAAGEVPAGEARAGETSAVVVAFDTGRIQVAAARQATVAIGEAFEMLSVVEEQATALAGAQGLAMEALHGRLAALTQQH